MTPLSRSVVFVSESGNMRIKIGGVIIAITRTAQTWLITVEHASTGAIIDEYTRAWPTEDEARAMACNAYRWFAYRATLGTAA